MTAYLCSTIESNGIDQMAACYPSATRCSDLIKIDEAYTRTRRCSAALHASQRSRCDVTRHWAPSYVRYLEERSVASTGRAREGRTLSYMGN